MTIHSSIALPDLLPGAAPADVSMRLGNIPSEKISRIFDGARRFESPGVRIRTTKRAMLFDWDRLGRVFVGDGREVIVEPDRDTLEEDLQPFLTGPVLAVLLHQRGYFVLHASAIEIDGRTVAFLGAKGFGKSTLAGYFKARGKRLISDDVVPVYFSGRGAFTVPGFPRIKLYDDSIKAIGADPDDFPPIHRFVAKRSFQNEEAFSAEPVRLRGVYVLSEGKTIEIEKMPPVEAFIEISKNTHLSRFLEALNCQPEYFAYCQKFTESVPVFRLSRPHDFAQIDEIRCRLERHAAEDFGMKGPGAADGAPNGASKANHGVASAG